LLHSVCDGVGACQFLKAIMEFARGKTEPSVKPVWERDRLKGSITKNPLQIDFLDECLSCSFTLSSNRSSHASVHQGGQ